MSLLRHARMLLLRTSDQFTDHGLRKIGGLAYWKLGQGRLETWTTSEALFTVAYCRQMAQEVSVNSGAG